tara:strand:- start:75 stop:251 length:177 start_codon:yes stop_codon:yes gene_type:complete
MLAGEHARKGSVDEAAESKRMLLKPIVLLARVLHVVELLLDLDLSLERGLGVARADSG